jgi:hypothetical protein
VNRLRPWMSPDRRGWSGFFGRRRGIKPFGGSLGGNRPPVRIPAGRAKKRLNESK